ncbi:MAG TPA: PAS domain-containing protein, partial [Euzebya sp.]|nr:PAS domain-containing protein [Euzebya sp.]
MDPTQMESRHGGRRKSDWADGERPAFNPGTAHVAVLDRQGRIVAANDAWHRRATDTGHDGAGVGRGGAYHAVLDAMGLLPSPSDAVEGLRAVAEGSSPDYSVDYPVSDAGGQRWFCLHARRLGDPDPQLLVVHEDITDRRRMHDEATARSVMIDQADAAIIATDLDGLVTMWS